MLVAEVIDDSTDCVGFAKDAGKFLEREGLLKIAQSHPFDPALLAIATGVLLMQWMRNPKQRVRPTFRGVESLQLLKRHLCQLSGAHSLSHCEVFKHSTDELPRNVRWSESCHRCKAPACSNEVASAVLWPTSGQRQAVARPLNTASDVDTDLFRAYLSGRKPLAFERLMSAIGELHQRDLLPAFVGIAVLQPLFHHMMALRLMRATRKALLREAVERSTDHVLILTVTQDAKTYDICYPASSIGSEDFPWQGSAQSAAEFAQMFDEPLLLRAAGGLYRCEIKLTSYPLAFDEAPRGDASTAVRIILWRLPGVADEAVFPASVSAHRE